MSVYRASANSEKKKGKPSDPAYPELIAFWATRTQRARLRHARDVRAINMSKFIRDAIDRALDELEGRPAQFAERRVAVRSYGASGSR
jgi:hypothetical protein